MRETQIFLFGISTFPFPPCLSLCSHPGLFIFPSYPKHGNAPRSSDLDCRLLIDVCTNRPPWTLVLSGSRCFSLSSSLDLNPPLHLCFSSFFVLWGSKEGWLNVLCPLWRHQLLFSVTAPEVCLWSQRLLLKTHQMAFALSFILALSSLCAATDIKGDS